MSIEGRTYLERGEPVTIVVQWGPGGGPRNVLIERGDGTQVVRPFRGLRKPIVLDEPTYDEIAAEKRRDDV